MEISWCHNKLVARMLSSKVHFSPALKWSVYPFTACAKVILLCFMVFTVTIFTSIPSAADQELIITEISGTEGDDVINNAAPVDASAIIDTSLSETVKTSATGIDALGGDDVIQNAASISSGASSTADVDEATDRTVMEASGVGVTGGAGVDEIINTADIDITAGAEALTLDATLPIIGNGAVDISTTAVTNSTGITGDKDADSIDNTGQVNLVSTSNSTAVGISLTVDGIVTGDGSTQVLSDAGATADAQAVGISGGDGVDRIHNQASVFVDLFATATTVDVGVLIEVTKDAIVSGVTLSDSSALAVAWATGISGGSGADTLYSDGNIAFLANADATAVGVTLTIAGRAEGDAMGTALTDTRSTAAVVTTGIAGGTGNDRIDNRSSILTEARATSTGVGVGTEVGLIVEQGGDVSGAALSNARATASVIVKGIDGGADIDVIENKGNIGLLANAEATGVSVSLAVDGTLGSDASGRAVSDARVTAEAAVSGIDGGMGDDDLTNQGALNELLAVSDATGIAATLDIAGTVSFKSDAEDEVAGSALSDSSVDALAAVVGMDGGSGDDTIENYGDLSLLQADATAVGVAAGLNVSAGVGFKGDLNADVSGAAVSDARVTAAAAVIGIDGGSDGDVIINRGDFGQLLARSNATGVAASLDVAGVVSFKSDAEGEVAGSALSDASVDALASVLGINGDAGDDTIENRNDLSLLQANATAVGVAADLNVSAGVGFKGDLDVDVSGAAVSDARVTAAAAVTGIGGGDGGDVIINTGDLGQLLAGSNATGVAASLDVAGVVSFKSDAKGEVDGSALSDASADALASVVGINGGAGGDTIENYGDLSLLQADATAVGVAAGLNVSAGVGFKGDLDVDVSGAAVSDARVTAAAAVTGIGGGDDGDVIINRGDFGQLLAGSNATGVAASLDVAGVVSFKSDAEGEVAGSALSDASVDALASVVGINGDAGDDTIENRGDLSLLQANATAVGVAAGLNVVAGASIKGDANLGIAGEAVSNARVTAAAAVTGINGGEGNDDLTNSGVINELIAVSDATGVAASLDVAGTVTFKGDAESEISGTALSNASVDALASVFGIDGGAGDDTIENIGDLMLLRADATALGVAASLNISAGVSVKGNLEADVTGVAVSDASALAEARLGGIDGGEGQDTIINEANLGQLLANATATGVAASLDISGALSVKGSVTGEAAGTAVSNASATAIATVMGIYAGDGDDTIENNGDFDNLYAHSEATGVAASLDITAGAAVKGIAIVDVEGAALSDASATAEAAATGLDGGTGNDSINNTGDLKHVRAESGATSVAASLAINGTMGGDTAGAAVSNSSATATTAALGIGGGEGADTITNQGLIAAEAASEADAVSVSADISIQIGVGGESTGSALSDASATAIALATGIDAGEGDDRIVNDGTILLMQEDQFNADAAAVAVGFTIATGGSAAEVTGKALSDSSTLANAAAWGITGGLGADYIENHGMIAADVGSKASATAVSAAFSLTTVGGTTSGAALSDASASSLAMVTGIGGGADNDWIENDASIDVTTTSDAEALAVSVSLAGGAVQQSAENKAVADSSAEAIAYSTGIDGGAGDDTVVTSTQKITAAARAHAEGDSVSVSIQAGTGGFVELLENASVADASARGEASATGIDSGAGNDSITNTSDIEATSLADADVTATSVTVGFTMGAAGNFGTADSSATAVANATGIEGGEEDDEIDNTGTLNVGASQENLGTMANAEANSTTVDVGIAVGYATGTASSDASATAEATAAGISGGAGSNTITNSGAVTVGPGSGAIGPLALAQAEGTTVQVGITIGASMGEASSDASATAVADLTGIRGGTGVDWIKNSGALIVGADPDGTTPLAKARAASETVDVAITLGGSLGDATSNASATAMSIATGIETDLGDDWIDNTGQISAVSASEAEGIGKTTKVSLTVGVSEGTTQSDASSFSTAFATGIDSGGNADTIMTDSEMFVKAHSASTSISTSRDYNILSIGTATQSAVANSSSTAAAIATGIDGGSGSDTISADGFLELIADTLVSGSSRSSSIAGLTGGESAQEAQSRTETTANSLAVGIDGGAGDDIITSTATLDLNAFSTAFTQAISSTNSGLNIAGASSGESIADATTTVTAAAIGIRGGAAEPGVDETDADVITSDGSISVSSTVSATTESTSTADSLTLFGSAEGKAVSNASAHVIAAATGIAAGADDDVITSGGSVEVTATANGSVSSTSNVDADVIFGDASSKGVSDASANVLAEATGISGGTGDDTITSRALVKVEAESIGSVTATSNVDADVTFGGASSEAASDASVTKKGSATGIDGGDGGDVITNYDTLYVRAISAGTVTSIANATADATFGSTSSITTTAAALEGTVDTAGIIGGSGGDRITNLGRVDSIADATLFVNNSSVATAESTFGSSDARASSVSTLQGKASSLGVSGDDGDDVIENMGAVNVRAIANATVVTSTVAIADSFWGSEYTEAASSNYAAGESTAEGITAGAGNDEILNADLITVETGGTVKIKSEVYSSDGPASSDARTMAIAHATGIDGGSEDDIILNMGEVLVTAAPKIDSAARTFGRNGHTDGKVGIELTADATGISGGAGIDTITNEGDILVFLGSPESESTVTEDATSGAITFTDNERIGADSETIVGKWIRIQVSDGRNFVTSVEEFDPETGTFTLHDPIKYDLAVNDGYTLYDYGDKTPDIESVQVTVGGRTQVDASTTASVRAQGIAGGEGDDQLSNSGAIAVSASNRIKAVTVTIAGNIVANTRVESSVNAVGIAGNDQSDTSDRSAAGTRVFTDLSRKGDDPEAIIGLQVVFESGASAGFTSLVSEFDPDTGTFILADPLPSGGLARGDNYTLGGGSDIIANLGTIDVSADGAIDASSWSLDFGTADVEARGNAQTNAAGIRSGGFADRIQNNGDISTRSTTDVSSTDRLIVFFGSADQELFFEASSKSAGVETGAGDDGFFGADNGSINAEAVSTASVNGVTAVLFANITNSVDAIADSTSLGVDLGEGSNIASMGGDLTSTSLATVIATAISEVELGETDADADAIANATARGIQAGGDGDQAFNQGRIEVNATADATSTAQGARVGNKDESSSATEDGSEDDKFFFDASLIPAEGEQPVDIVGEWIRFTTGENEDFFARVNAFIPETGELILNKSLIGDLYVDDLYTRSAARDGTSAATAAATAIGIDLGDGNAVVGNENIINVHAVATADTTATAFGGTAIASAEAAADARGIVTGSGDDVVANYDAITVTAEVLTQAAGTGVTETQSVTARGIDTGAGVDTVLNEGEITVTAIAAVMEATTGVIGISTGDGNDILLNAGTGSIAASTVIAGIAAPATAISTGAGQDLVSLLDQSSITGHIDLGLDDDLLTLADEVTVVGKVIGGAGTDTLRIEDRGTFTLAPPVEMERLEINQGVLEFAGNYTFSLNGLKQAEIYNPDTGDLGYGQLVINGEVGLDGTAAVIARPRIYTDGEALPLLSAESIRIEEGSPTEFATVNLPPDSALVKFGFDYRFDVAGRDLFEVTTAVDPFRIVARNSLQRAVAGYLERITPTASGDLAEVIGTFQLLPPDADFDTVFTSLSPDTHDNYTRASYDAVTQYLDVIDHRMQARRVSSLLPGAAVQTGAFGTGGSLLLAYNGPVADMGPLHADDAMAVPAWWRDFWGTAFGRWGDQDGEKGYTGFDYDMLGVTLGFDRPVNEHLLLGVSAAYTDTDVDQDKGRGDGDIDSWIASFYGNYTLDRAYVDATLSYGQNDYDAKRKVQVGTIQRTARSDHDGDVVAASLGSGYLISREDTVLEPFGRLQYIRLDEDAFTESGAGSVNQRISSRDTESLTSEIGLRVSRAYQKATGQLTAGASVAWLHDFDIDDRSLTTSYMGAPVSSFSIPGQDVERNGVTLGLGVGFETRKGVSTSLNYNGEFRDGFSAHGIIGRISYQF